LANQNIVYLCATMYDIMIRKTKNCIRGLDEKTHKKLVKIQGEMITELGRHVSLTEVATKIILAYPLKNGLN
jgi:hypothetical protein